MAAVLCVTGDLWVSAVGVAMVKHAVGHAPGNKLLCLAGINQLPVMALVVFAFD